MQWAKKWVNFKPIHLHFMISKPENEIGPIFFGTVKNKFAQVKTCAFLCKKLLAHYDTNERHLSGNSRSNP